RSPRGSAARPQRAGRRTAAEAHPPPPEARRRAQARARARARAREPAPPHAPPRPPVGARPRAAPRPRRRRAGAEAPRAPRSCVLRIESQVLVVQPVAELRSLGREVLPVLIVRRRLDRNLFDHG